MIWFLFDKSIYAFPILKWLLQKKIGILFPQKVSIFWRTANKALYCRSDDFSLKSICINFLFIFFSGMSFCQLQQVVSRMKAVSQKISKCICLLFHPIYITKFELPSCLCILEPGNSLAQILLTWNSFVIVASPFKELLLPHLEE